MSLRPRLQTLPHRIHWLTQSGIPITDPDGHVIIVISAIGGLTNDELPELEDFFRISKIVRTRSLSKQHTLVSASIDKDEDFIPISFLETGIKQSSSVCRIARYFPHSIFLGFVKNLESAIEQLGSVPHNFDAVDKVVEIFSIPQQIADDIFSESVRRQIQVGDKTPLKALQDITETQLVKILPIPIGTGFLVGGSHLLTNHHVIPDAETADQCVAQFNFVEDLQGESQKSIDYEFDSTLFVSDRRLDYTLVQLKSDMFTRQAGFEYGWIRLIENNESVAPRLVWIEFEGTLDRALKEGKTAIDALTSRGYTVISANELLIIWHPEADDSQAEIYEQEEIKALGRLMGVDAFKEPSKHISASLALKRERGDSIIVVQHPKGRQKQIVLNNNEVITNGLYKDFLRYKADADYGSSGSPAFNTRWELVALHHAAVPKKNENSIQQSSDRTSILCHQGVRTCRIVEDLKRRSTDNFKLQSFLQDFVITAEQLNYPPLPAALKFNGISDYVSTDSRIAFASCATDFFNSQDKRSTELGLGTIKLWNQDGIELRTLSHPGVKQIEFSSDGQLLLSASTSQINIWNLDTGELTTTVKVPFQMDDPDEQQKLLSNSPYASVEYAIEATQPYGFIDSFSLCPTDNTLLATADLSETVTLWNIESETWLNEKDGKLLTECPELKELKGRLVCFSPNGNILATFRYSVNQVKFWQVGEWKHSSTVEVVRPAKICFSSDSRTAAIVTEENLLHLIDVEHGTLSKQLEGYEAPSVEARNIEFRIINGTERLMACSKDRIKFWNTDGILDQEIPINPAILQQQQEFQKATFSPDGKYLLTFGYAQDISLSTIESTAIIRCINHVKRKRLSSEMPYADVKFSPAAQILAPITTNPTNNPQTLTIEAWVNPDLNGSGTIVDIALSPSLTWDSRLVLSVVTETELIACLNFEKAGSIHSGIGTLEFGRFNHIAAVIALEESASHKFYVNGQPPITVPPTPYSNTKSATIPNSPYLRLTGASLEYNFDSTLEVTNNFKGTISEIRVWNVERTQEEIRASMYQRLNGKEAGLIEYWKFEGHQVQKIRNLAGHQEKLGIICGATQLTATQLYGFNFPYGLEFSKADDIVETNDHFAVLETHQRLNDAITIEAWVKLQFGNSCIASQGEQDEQGKFLQAGYEIVWHNGKIRVIMQSANSTDIVIVETREQVSQGHHVAFSWKYDRVADKGNPTKNEAGEIWIYIDGRLQDCVVIEGQSRTIVTAGKTQTVALFKGSLESITAPIQIGAKAKREDYRLVAIAEVRLWNVFRPPDQVKTNMTRHLDSDVEKPNGLIGYWRFDEGRNDQVSDFISGVSATIRGAKWFPSPP